MGFISYTNPYMAGDPVGKQPSFVGREDVLRDVLRVLRHPQQNAITLYGQRRIGKTSILQYLEAHLPEEGTYLPVLFDLMNSSGKPLDALLRELANTIAGALQREQPDLGEKPQQAFQERWLPALLESLPEGSRLVMLMDEFDVQADPDADKQLKQAFFGYMRKLRRLAPARLKFVFVLGRTIDDLDIVAKGLFKDLPSRRVSLLKRADAEHLIHLSERQDGLRWTEAAVERIWALTHGQPYLIQALCNEIWERAYEENDAPPPVTAEQVDEAVPDAMERSENMFTWLWEGLGPAEKVVAAALAEAGPTIVDEEQLRHILSESGVRILIRELQDAPKLLQDWDILEPADGGYRFRVELLRRWIAEHKPLSRVQSELDRVHPAADGFYQAGRNLYLNGDIPRATNSLQQALELNPNHQGALELLGEIQLAQGNLDAAQETLERLLALSPARARARLKQIYLKRAESTENEEEQLAWYEKILAFYPQDADALKGKQEIERRRRQRQIQEAKDEIARLEQSQQFAAALEKAQALQRQFPEEEDLSALTQEIEQHFKAWRIQNALDEIKQLEQEQRFTTALEKAQAWQKEFPEEESLAQVVKRLEQKARLGGLYQEAQDALEKGDRETAIRYLQEIITTEPRYREGEAVVDLYKAITGEDIHEMKAALGNLRRALEKKSVVAKPRIKWYSRHLIVVSITFVLLQLSICLLPLLRVPFLETLITPTYTAFPTFTSAPRLTSSPTPEPGTTWTRPTDSMAMVYIPAGCFQMGSENGDSDERPVHEVCLDAFWMDTHEVTNAMYAQFLNERGNQKEGGATWLDAGGSGVHIHRQSEGWVADTGYADHPVVEVRWYGARAYCEWVGGRLPTEAEWEYAARGGLAGKRYPWGDESPICKSGAKNGAQYESCSGKTVQVTTFAPNGYGLYDMAGNVWEWMADWYDKNYYQNALRQNPTGPESGEYRVLRSGSWYYSEYFLRVANRFRDDPSNTNVDIGFRCLRSP